MEFNEADWEYTLASGRKVRSVCGVFGLIDDGAGFALVVGFDHRHDEWDDPLTPAERQEIADEMIRRWRAWANAPAPAEHSEPAS